MSIAYIPVLLALPRMLVGRWYYYDVLWAIPMALSCACMWMLLRWFLFGLTLVGRIVWIGVLILAMGGYPFGIIGVSVIKMPHTGRY